MSNMSQLNVWEHYPYRMDMRVYKVEYVVVSYKDKRSNALWPAPIWITDIATPALSEIIFNTYPHMITAGLMVDGDIIRINATEDRNTIEQWLRENITYGGEIKDTRTERSPNVNVS